MSLAIVLSRGPYSGICPPQEQARYGRTALAPNRAAPYLHGMVRQDGPRRRRDGAHPAPQSHPRAFARLAEINEASGEAKALRVAVEGGGCSGFQYEIRLDEPAPDDLVLEGEGQKVVVDSVSLPFLANAVIDFSEELIGARFVIENPNASSSCGCGTSFSM
jgi:iron-sulfur cluster insertion protein